MEVTMRRIIPRSRFRTLIAVFLLAGILPIRPLYGKAMEPFSPRSPKYIFIFLADGAGVSHLETARMYNRRIHREGFYIVDRVFKEGSLGLITTHSADSFTTDSAASATALANGCKAKNAVVGICENGTRPLSVLEVAKKKGMRLGLITNSTVYDASPASFSAHVANRNLTAQIIDAFFKLEPDLLMGGGRDWFLPKLRKGGRRTDGRDLISLFREKGYAYISDKRGLGTVKGPKVLGQFHTFLD